MYTLFTTIRLWAYIAIISSSAVVLGISAKLASNFLPDLHRDFTILSLIVPPATIVFLAFLLLRSQPRIDVFFTFVISVLWLTMGAWTVDIIGGIQCDALGSQRMPIKNDRTVSAQTYCREMKVIEAFSWANFVICAISLAVLISLASRAQSIGRHHVWRQSISELPWFGEVYDGYGGSQSYGGYPQYQSGGPYVVHQQPGHSVVIQQGQGNHPPNVQQIPGMPGTSISG